MTVENRSSGLLPVRSDGRLWIRALKEMRELRGQGGVSGQSKLRVVLYERLSVPDITRRWKKKTHPDRKRAVSSKHPRRLWPHPPPIKPMSRLCYPIPHIIVSSYHTHTHAHRRHDIPAIITSTPPSPKNANFSAPDWTYLIRPSESPNARRAASTIPALGSVPTTCLNGVSSTVAWPVPVRVHHHTSSKGHAPVPHPRSTAVSQRPRPAPVP